MSGEYVFCECGVKFIQPIIWPLRCSCGKITYQNGVKPFIPQKTTINNNNNNSVSHNKTNIDKASLYKKWGNLLWEKLHTKVKTPKDFKGWLLHIPCGTCKQDFNTLIKEYPPDFSSQENFFEWTVLIHNKVNEKLNKPTFTLEQAKERWCIIN